MEQIQAIDFSIQNSHDVFLQALNNDGIVIIKNLFTSEVVDDIASEFDRIFIEHKNLIDVLDKEDCSKDERIFHAQKLSPFIKDNYADHALLNKLSNSYTSRAGNLKKTLINQLKFKKGVTNSSGGGWHRDNHDCQFKSIMYLTDVDESQGNFQWITNSSKRHIGYPTPRTASYNTRYADDVVDSIVETNKSCELVNITGPKGTVILADTTYIHRGKVIEADERKAITQYYF